MAIVPRSGERRLTRPHHHLHAERLPVSGDRAADPAIAIDTKRLAPQRLSNPDLPFPSLEGGHLLWDLAHRRKNQPPRQFSGGIRWYARVLAGRHDHSKPGASIDVDMRIHAALADKLELRQALKQWRPDVCPFSNQHYYLGVR